MSSPQVPSSPEQRGPKAPVGGARAEAVRTGRAPTRRAEDQQRDGGADVQGAPDAPGGDGAAVPAGSGEGPAGRTPSQEVGRPAQAAGTPTTVLPGATGSAGFRRPTRPAAEPAERRAAAGRPATKRRRTRLAVQRVDPWSVFLYSLVASLFLGVALVVAVAVLYAVLGRLGVIETVNELFIELTGGDADAVPILTSGRFVGGAVVLAAVNVVLLTLLATLSALLYNLCASFTGGIEVTLGERDN